MLYGVPVEATIANGKLLTLDTSTAEKCRGVRAIFHRGNMERSSFTPAPGFDRVCLERRHH
jgi:xanthine dehydrogenase YagR molybdenum-binding subunit